MMNRFISRCSMLLLAFSLPEAAIAQLRTGVAALEAAGAGQGRFYQALEIEDGRPAASLIPASDGAFGSVQKAYATETRSQRESPFLNDPAASVQRPRPTRTSRAPIPPQNQ